ncbi:mitochondrial fission protein [Aureococcus anophagefferens]|uniref:Mitochondrial fission protein n=1 Tax=Aureococcus anophagefferens TaxID=44056 RepID=A0ABR1G7T1_AURAN
MDRGTSARDVFTGASGDVPRLKLGYVGVVNRSQADINEKKSIHDARAFERDYFAKSDAYRDLAPTLGTAHLVSRCSELLVQHIRVSLPTLERELAESLAAKRKKLSDFGDQTPDAKRRKLTEALLHFCDRYAALISGAPLPHGGGAHATDELRGGARIEAVFRDVFAAEVDRVAVLDDLSPGEVQTLVRNVHGLGGGLFTPDQAFVQLVQRNVRRLARPATRCVELVHAELVKLVDVAGDFEGIAVFPALRGGLAEIVNGKLRDALDAADATLRTLVDMELARINITHPDFVGRDGVGPLLARKERDLLRDEERRAKAAPPESPRSVSGSNPMAKAPPPRGPPPIPKAPEKRSWLGGARGHADGADDGAPGAKKVLSPGEVEQMRAMMVSEVGPVAPAVAVSPSGLADAGAAASRRARLHAFTAGLGMKEKVEVEVICDLCESYFAIVKKAFADLVPKAVTLKLVDATTGEMTPFVLAQLNKDETVDALMGVCEAVQGQIADLTTSVAALEKATKTLAEMRAM